MSKRINVSMSEEKFNEISGYCMANGITMSSFMTLCAMDKINVDKAANALQMVARYAATAATSGDKDAQELMHAVELLQEVQSYGK